MRLRHIEVFHKVMQTGTVSRLLGAELNRPRAAHLCCPVRSGHLRGLGGQGR